VEGVSCSRTYRSHACERLVAFYRSVFARSPGHPLLVLQLATLADTYEAAWAGVDAALPRRPRSSLGAAQRPLPRSPGCVRLVTADRAARLRGVYGDAAACELDWATPLQGDDLTGPPSALLWGLHHRAVDTAAETLAGVQTTYSSLDGYEDELQARLKRLGAAS
jgi:hypothetical protein